MSGAELELRPMTAADWPAVRAIHVEGSARVGADL
jgi:hypothetical protein